MKFIDKIFKPKTENKNYISVLSSFISKDETYSTFDLVNGIIYACIDKRANAVAKYEQLVRKNGKDIDQHWIYDLLNKNPYASWTTLKMLISKWLDTNGNAYLWTKVDRND